MNKYKLSVIGKLKTDGAHEITLAGVPRIGDELDLGDGIKYGVRRVIWHAESPLISVCVGPIDSAGRPI